MNKKIELKNGQTVHHCSFWDRTKGMLITSWIISFVIGISTENIGNAFVFWIPLLIPIWIGKTILQSIGLIPFKDTCSISFSCPYCKIKSWFLFPSLRMTCPNCKKEVGYYEDKVYKITKENENHFKTEQEKTNILLEKQLNDNASDSKLTQIKELKELLDMGAITQEEFDEKKKELLK